MATSAPLAPTLTPATFRQKQQFTDVFLRENATTRRVLAAIGDGQSEFRPQGSSKAAREVANIFCHSQGGIASALNNQWQWPPHFGPAPTTMAEVLANFDATTELVKQALASAPESRLFETVPFLTAPKQVGEVPVIQLMWFMLLDAIHHRGQLSIYLRMSGGKVPSIYGPSADEPWM
jgi:uncharacterized damage-inducible protein DinB